MEAADAAPALSAPSTLAPSAHPAHGVRWLEDADRLYPVARSSTAPARPPFGRVYAKLTLDDADPSLFECPQNHSRHCSLDNEVYVRAEPVEGGLAILPQCSVMSGDVVVAPAARRAPWTWVSGALSSGSTAKLRGRAGATLTLRISLWTDPGPLPPLARDAWIYTRSLIVGHARSYGIALDIDGAALPCAEDATAQGRDACRATRGSPLAMLMDPEIPRPMNGEPDPMSRAPDFWVRERVLAPVHRGEASGFTGRPSHDELRVTCPQVQERMGPFADALVASGVDIVRYTLGAILTDGDLYYPQVSLRRFAHVLDCLGLTGRVLPALHDLATLPALDWQNRFRAACVSRLLEGRACDVDLLREILGPQAAPAGEHDAVDRACIEGLTGQWILGE